MIVLYILMGLLFLFLLIVLFLYTATFSANRILTPKRDYIPRGLGYAPYREDILRSIADVRAAEGESIYILSTDGLSLHGTYYHNFDNAPLMIFFHGYRGTAARDGCGAFHFCKDWGYNLLSIDQRATGKSEGHVITFGVMERLDARSWIDYAIKRFGKEQKMILMGLSMGAATVLMACEHPFPQNVRGVVADSGFTSPHEIICKVMERIKLPSKLLYPLVRLSAKLLGRFDPDRADAEQAVKKATIPVFLIHGEQDLFVPVEMSRRNYEACTSEKELLIVPGASHGMSYYVDNKAYLEQLHSFLDGILEK